MTPEVKAAVERIQRVRESEPNLKNGNYLVSFLLNVYCPRVPSERYTVYAWRIARDLMNKDYETLANAYLELAKEGKV